MPFNIPTQREHAVNMVQNATRANGPSGELAIAQALIYVGDVIKATAGSEGNVEAALRSMALEVSDVAKALREANDPPRTAA